MRSTSWEPIFAAILHLPFSRPWIQDSRRNMVVSPFFEREEKLGAFFFQARVFERPQWFTSNSDLVERYGVEEREVEWD